MYTTIRMSQSKNKKLAKIKADKNFAAFIRERDKNKPCITCGGGGVKDAGHFMSRRFESTRYDEKNVYGQCVQCNRFQYGNQFTMGLAIDQIHGKGTAEKLEQKARMRCNRIQYDYEMISIDFRMKLEQLKQ